MGDVNPPSARRKAQEGKRRRVHEGWQQVVSLVMEPRGLSSPKRQGQPRSPESLGVIDIKIKALLLPLPPLLPS